MKKLIIFLMFLPILGVAQITIEQDTVLKSVGYEWKFSRLINSAVSEPIPIGQDTIIYTFDVFPEVLGKEYELKTEQIGDTLYSYTNNLKAVVTYSRRIIIYQMVRKYVTKKVPRNTDKSMLMILRKGKKLNATNKTFWNFAKTNHLVSDSLIVK